jgi:putative ABC transport system permease protein
VRAGFLLRMAVREVRTGWQRLLFFLLSIAVGVGALVGIASFSANLEGAIRREARTLMAADLELSSSQVFDAATLQAVREVDGARVAELAEMPSMAARVDGTRSQLVELKAVRGGYPFYGELIVEPARPLPELLAEGIVVEEGLLLQLNVAVGDEVKLGSRSFRVAGLLKREPDRVAAAFSLGPRVLMALADVEAAGLITLGSRVRHRMLLALPAELDAVTVAAELDAALPDERVQVRSFEAAQPTLRMFLARMRDFLRLATLVTLVLGGLGVAQSIRVFLQAKQDTVAILKVLGASTGEVTAVFVVQCLGLALLGSGLGLGLGVLIQQALPRVVGELLPVEIVGEFVPVAALEGLAVGVVTALLFCLLPLLSIRGVAPAQILRRELAAVVPVADRRARVLALVVLGGGLVGLAAWLAGSWRLGAIFVGGVAAALLVLSVASAAGLWLLRRLPRARSLSARQGLGNLTRPGSQAAAVMVSLGLGVAVIAQIQLVQSGLLARVADDAPADAPNFFFVGILPDQVEPFRALLTAQGAFEGHRLVPIVQARLAKVGGREVAEMSFASESDERSVTREFAITWQDELPPGNEVVAGTWWSAEAGGRESWVSIEENLAQRIEVRGRRGGGVRHRGGAGADAGGERARGRLGAAADQLHVHFDEAGVDRGADLVGGDGSLAAGGGGATSAAGGRDRGDAERDGDRRGGGDRAGAGAGRPHRRGDPLHGRGERAGGAGDPGGVDRGDEVSSGPRGGDLQGAGGDARRCCCGRWRSSICCWDWSRAAWGRRSGRGWRGRC